MRGATTTVAGPVATARTRCPNRARTGTYRHRRWTRNVGPHRLGISHEHCWSPGNGYSSSTGLAAGRGVFGGQSVGIGHNYDW